MKYNVLVQDFNSRKFVPYDIFPYLTNMYNREEKKPENFEEFKRFIDSTARYQWWARCEYEIIVSGWPNTKDSAKIDVYYQILLNLDVITKLFMEHISNNEGNMGSD